MTGDDLAAFDQGGEPRCHFAGARLTTGLVNPSIQEGIGAPAGINGHGSGAKRGGEEILDVEEQERCNSGHEVRAIDKGQPFFGFELNGLQTCRQEGGPTREPLSIEPALPFTHEDQGCMSQRRKVAGSAD
jgi:hypothetical protein